MSFGQGGDLVTTVWDVMTFLWESAIGFLNNRIDIMGLHFTLWEFAFGSAVLLLVCSVVFKNTD